MVALVLPAGAGATTFDLTRIATDVLPLDEDLAAIGYVPACIATPEGGSITSSTAYSGNSLGDTDWEPPVAQQLLGKSTIFAYGDYEGLATCHPTTIISDGAPSKPNANYAAIAPAIYLGTYTAAVGVSCPSTLTCSDWKPILMKTGPGMAQQLGSSAPQQRVAMVLANMDRRIAAIRGQVAGKTFAPVSIGPSSFEVTGEGYIWVGGLENDLGVKNILWQLPDSDWPNDTPEAVASTNGVSLSNELLPQLSSADAVLESTSSSTAAQIGAFNSNPLWSALPAVKAGHVASYPTSTDGGVLNTDFLYGEVEKAFGISEYHATLNSGPGPWTNATVTLNPATKKVCWAISPPAGAARPASAIGLDAALSAKKSAAVTLTRSSMYVDPEQDDPSGTGNDTWETTPETFQTTGCKTLTATVANRLKSSPGKVTLVFGHDRAPLQAGEASILYSSLPVITAQPSSQTIRVGQKAKLTAAATGSPDPTVSWESSSDRGKKWTVIPGAFRSSRDTAPLTQAANGRLYRAVFTNTAGIEFSKAARIRVEKKR